jgi:hypothetical protein
VNRSANEAAVLACASGVSENRSSVVRNSEYGPYAVLTTLSEST